MMQRTRSRQLTWGCCCPLFAYHVTEHRTQGSGAQCTCSAQQAHSVCTRAAEAEGRRRWPCAVGCTSRSSLAHGVHLQWAWPSCSCCTDMCWWKQLEARLHVVERGYLQTPTHEIVSLMNDSCLAVRSFYDMKVACRFVLQLRLFHWLERRNCEHGVGVFSPLFLFLFFCFASLWLDYSPLSQRVISETQDWLWSRVTVFKSGAALNSFQPIYRCVFSRLAHALTLGLWPGFSDPCAVRHQDWKVDTMPSNNERPYGKWWQNSVGQLVAD